MDADNAKLELLRQTSKIKWRELQRFFAAGKVIFVSRELDLMTVGTALIQDNKSSFEHWTNANQIHPVSDQQALNWNHLDALMWATVVSPWVLIQEIAPNN